MTRYKIIIFSLTIMTYISYGQDTLWIQEGDKSKMELSGSTWIFKNNLEDGNYVSYLKENGNKYITNFASFKNRKKNGRENRYYFLSKNRYAEINWSNGLKNGNEIHFEADGTLKELFTFKNNSLNGQYIKSYGKGLVVVKGYYKNAFCDSIWTYYKYRRVDSLSFWKYKECKYKNGEPILISAWTKDGNQTVRDGQGFELDSNYITTKTEYTNGKKNGWQIAKKPNGNFINEKYFSNGLLIKERLYNDSNKIISFKEWSHPLTHKIDTIQLSIDTWISDIIFYEIKRETTPTPNGHWTAWYQNGTVVYDGNYINGQRTGNWIWNYSNGKKRIVADYSKNLWQHLDTNGTIVSEYNNECITYLTNNWWFLNRKLDKKILQLTKNNKKTVTPRLTFYYNGQLEINSYLECGKDIAQTLNSYNLLADKLTITTVDQKNKKTNYYYKIASANDDLIILKWQKQGSP